MHLVVSVFKELVVTVLVVLGRCLALPLLELFFEFFVALVCLLALVVIFPGCPSSLLILVLFLLLLPSVQVIQVLFSKGVPSLISFQSLKGSRQLLKLGLVAGCFDVRMVHPCKLQVDSLQVSLTQPLA